MHAAELIEKRRFVGREFLLWLWFESELFEGEPITKGRGTLGLWLESEIVLSAGKEQSRLKGALPSTTAEAREALRRGKLPDAIRIRVSRGEEEFAFALKGETLGLTGLKLPVRLREEKHEQFYERMHLTLDIETVLSELYSDFLALRLSPAWKELVVPAMEPWVRGEGLPPADEYREARELSLEPRGRKRTEEASIGLR